MDGFLKWLGTLVFGATTKPVAPNSRIMNDHLRATQKQKRVVNSARKAHSDNAVGQRRRASIVRNCTGRIESVGPGKNVLVGYQEADEAANAGETLTLEEFDAGESGEAVAFDPYNTGRFDRSASWSKIPRK